MQGSEWFISTATAARQLGVHQKAVLRYYHSGILRGKRSGRRVVVDQHAVLALMKVMQWVRDGKPTPPHERVSGGDGASTPVPGSEGLTRSAPVDKEAVV